MSGQTDEVKGRAKQAAGVVTGDKAPRERRQGRSGSRQGEEGGREGRGQGEERPEAIVMRANSSSTIAFGAIAASASAGAADWTTDGSSPAVQVAGNEEQPDADDSGRNVRDRDDRTLTPGIRGGSDADRAITQRIRQAVVEDDDLSMNAKNVKIITVDGVVTLRGPVKTAAEKTKIASVSAKADGVKRVDNQIEVEAQE